MSLLREHLEERGLFLSNYKHVYLDEEQGVVTFLLFNLHGTLSGYQTYRPGKPKNTSFGRKQGFDPRELRYFTKALKGNPFFGAENFDPTRGKLYLVEGVFDAVKLHALGLNAFAMLGNDPVPQKQFLRLLNQRLVGVLDGDAAGQELASYCDEVVVCPDGKDPGDMTLEELKRML